MAINLKTLLTVDATDFIKGFKDAQKEVNNLNTATANANQQAGAAFGKLANQFSGLSGLFSTLKVAVTGAFAGLAYGALNMADAMDDLSKSSGFAVGKLLELRAALLANGGEFDTAARMIPIFSGNLDQAAQGGLSAQRTFERLGIDLQGLRSMSDAQIFDKVLDELAELTRQGKNVEAQALAIQVFGKAAKGIDFSGAVGSIEELRGKFDEYAEAIRQGGQLSDQLKAKTEALQLAFLKVFEPFIGQIGQTKVDVDKLTESLRTVVQVLAAILALNFFVKVVQGIMAITEAVVALRAASALLARTPVGILITGGALVAGALGVGAFKAAGSALGGGEQPKAPETAAPNAAAAAAGDAARAAADNQRKVIDGLAQQLQGIRDIGEAYKRNNQQQIARLNLETNLIGATDTEKEIAKALFDVRAKGEDQIYQLQKQRATAIAQDNPRLVGAIDAEISVIRKLTAEQLKNLEETIKRQQVREAQQRFAVAQIQGQIDLENLRYGILGETQSAESKFLQQKALWQVQGITRSKEELDYELAKARAIDEQTQKLLTQKTVRDITRQSEDTVKDIQDRMAVDSAANEMQRRLKTNEIDINKRLRDEIRKIQDSYGEESTLSEDQLRRRQAAIDAATEAYRKMKAEIDTTIETDQKKRESFEFGWQEAINKYVEAAGNGADQARRYFETFAKGAEDALMTFVKTGKLSFRDLANSLIQEFARNEIRNLISGLFGGQGGGGFGTSIIGSLIGGLFGGGKAAGGPVLPGKTYLVGERGPELFTPDTAGNISNQVAAAGNTTNVVYNIQAADAASFKQMIARDPEFLYALTEKGRMSLPGGRR